MASPSRPLGVLDTFQATPEALSVLKYIADFNLSEVMEHHVRWCKEFAKGECEIDDHAQRARLELDLKRFLALPLLFSNPKADFVPRYPVDLFWHGFILYTRQYREFCQRVYGRYLDHVPAKNREDAANDSRAVAYTLECLNQAFGNYHPDQWKFPLLCRCDLAFKRR